MNSLKRKNTNKTKDIFEKILQDIIGGELYQGQRLIEQELIDIYKVSKTPLREALIRLEKVGIVERKLNRGFQVRRITPRDAKEIYELREVIEGLAARLAAKNITEKDILKIKKIINNMKECINRNQVSVYLKNDEEFHCTLSEISGNDRLKEIFDNLMFQIKMLLATSVKLPGRGIIISFNEHKEIVDALLNKNSKKTEEKMKEHIINTKIEIVKHFNDMGL